MQSSAAIPYPYHLEEEPYVDHAIIRSVLSFLPTSQRSLRILEAGCGAGYFTNLLTEMAHHVVGIDTSDTGIAAAQKRYPNIRFEVQSVYSPLNKITGSVDFVIATEVIEHLLTPKEFLKNAHEALHPGGSLIISTPYHGYLKNLLISLANGWDKHHAVHWDGGHIKFFSPNTLTHMLKECGFKTVSFNNAGRTRWLWRSIVCAATK